MPKGVQFWNRKHVPPMNQLHIQVANIGYNRKVCCLCNGKAIYRAGAKGYCRNHKQKAAEWWAKHPMQFHQSILNNSKIGGNRAVRAGGMFGILPGVDRGRRVHVSY